MASINYPLFVLFGFAPSIIWLLFYLRRDVHPEPNAMILRVFFWGMAATIPAIGIELALRPLLKLSLLSPQLLFVLYVFLGIALVEEVVKFLVVKWKVFSNSVSALDEPMDLVLYMIISALGFAALENVLILAGLGPFALPSHIVALSFFRFLGATFLHTLSSGVLGYFLVFASLKRRFSLLTFSTGLALATLLHGAFNLFIIKGEGWMHFGIPLIIICSTAIFLFFAISKVKNMKGVCKL
jgi:RsiW-degrading membrane proteinase PrsW (M82 family)